MLVDLFFVILLPTVVIVAATVALGRRPSVAEGESDSDSVSFVGGVISALFTVVLAFYIVFAWQAGADVAGHADTEADALLGAYWAADVLPDAQRVAVQSDVREYASVVVDDEWALLAAGDTEPRTAEIVRDLRNEFAALPADGGVAESAREQGLRDVRTLDEAHRARVDLSTSGDAFNGVLLGGTILGAALMVAFPLLVGLSATPVNVIVMAVLTLVIGATVFLAIQLTHPLEGMFGVDPSAFVDVLAELTSPARPT